MAQINLPDQQTLELADEIAGTDDTLRAALSPYYPDLANCDIARKKTGDAMVVTVTKRAGTKGASPLDHLVAAEESLNPAVEMNRELLDLEIRGALSAAELLRRAPEIERAVERGRKQIDHVTHARRFLAGAEAETSVCVPEGF
ncbi:MAG: hypothetical protein L0229_20465 [Blastocatellia bacterium]|nr:hypothetical protein [Blastocatellia bacterium]